MSSEADRHSNSLILVPTSLELEQVAGFLPNHLRIRQCGFGPVAAGIETAVALAEGGFRRVILLGIAGTYDSRRLPVGSAFSFSRVACYGVGSGAGADFKTPRDLGFAQTVIDGIERFDEFPLETGGLVSRELLLTVASSAASTEQVGQRLKTFPAATAEDMEGFAVAMAATRLGRPTTIIRGISNVAGDRNLANWRIGPALQAAANGLLQVLALPLPE